MKRRFRILLCTLLTTLTVLGTAVGANPYLQELTPSLPSERMDVYSATYTGANYYISKEAGGLYSSADALEWQPVAGMERARIIADGKQQSDKLVVLSDNTLFVSYDGAAFAPVRQFEGRAVVHCSDGVYVAAVWQEGEGQDGELFVSFDLEHWTGVLSEPLTGGSFFVERHGDEAILSGLPLARGTVSAVVRADGTVRLFDYTSMRFDYTLQRYIGLVSDSYAGITKFAVSPSIDGDFEAISFSTQANSSCYIGLFNGSYYMSVYSYDTQKSTYYTRADGETWQQADSVYFYYDTRHNDDGGVTEIYTRQTGTADGTERYATVIRRYAGDTWQQAEVLGGYTIQMYGSLYTFAKTQEGGGYPAFSGLFSSDGINYHQTDAQRAYILSNLYAQRGDYMFIDNFASMAYQTDTGQWSGPPVRLYRLIGDPYEAIAQNGIEVRLNGSYIAFDQPPVIINDRTMVPLRGIFEALGANVEWRPDTREVWGQKDGRQILLTLDSSIARITAPDGSVSEAVLDAPATIAGDRTMVPVRFIAETFGMSADWDSQTRTVLLTSY